LCPFHLLCEAVPNSTLKYKEKRESEAGVRTREGEKERGGERNRVRENGRESERWVSSK